MGGVGAGALWNSSDDATECSNEGVLSKECFPELEVVNCKFEIYIQYLPIQAFHIDMIYNQTSAEIHLYAIVDYLMSMNTYLIPTWQSLEMGSDVI